MALPEDMVMSAMTSFKVPNMCAKPDRTCHEGGGGFALRTKTHTRDEMAASMTRRLRSGDGRAIQLAHAHECCCVPAAMVQRALWDLSALRVRMHTHLV